MQDVGITPLEIAGLIAGVVLSAVRGFPLIVRVLNNAAFAAQILKLIAADNVDRAIKLCSAMPKAYFIRMVRPLLDVSEIDAELGQGLVREELEVRFYRAQKQQLKKAWGLWWLGFLGLLLAGAAAGMAFTQGGKPPPAVAAAPGVALLINIWAVRKVQRLGKESDEHGKKIIAAMTRHIVAKS